MCPLPPGYLQMTAGYHMCHIDCIATQLFRLVTACSSVSEMRVAVPNALSRCANGALRPNAADALGLRQQVPATCCTQRDRKKRPTAWPSSGNQDDRVIYRVYLQVDMTVSVGALWCTHLLQPRRGNATRVRFRLKPGRADQVE